MGAAPPMPSMIATGSTASTFRAVVSNRYTRGFKIDGMDILDVRLSTSTVGVFDW